MNNKIFTFFIILPLFLLGFINVGWGQIAAWDFSGQSSPSTYAATTFNTNLVSTSGASNITRGAGAPASSASNCFRTQGFQNNGISTSNTDYFQVTIQANTGYKVSLSTIDAKFGGTSSFFATPGVTSQFAYSLDGTNFTLIGSPVQSTNLTMTQISLSSIGALQNVVSGTTITLRYYASGQTTTGGWGFQSASSVGTNGLVIGGSVTASTAPPPTIQASGITFSNVLTNQMTATWTNGDGAKRIVKMNTNNSFTDPADGTDPTANTVYGGSGEQVVYNNNSNSVTVSGLSQNTTYWYRVYEYNGTGSGTKYLTSAATNNPNSQTTSSANLPTKLVITSINSGNFVQVNPSTFSMTIQSQDDKGVAQNVVSQTDISLRVASGTGSLEGTLNGTISAGSNSVTISGITYGIPESGVSIQASVISGDELASGTSSPFTVYSQTPSNQPTNLTFSNINLTGFTASFTAASGSPAGYLVLRKSGSVYPTGTPALGTVYNIGDVVGNDTVAYIGSSATFTESALTSGTQYSYSVFSYNGSGSTINYLTTVPLQNQQYSMFSEPTTQATSIAFSNVSGTGFTVGWTKGNGLNSLVLVKAGSPVDATPADGSFYKSNTTLGNGDTIGTGNYVVYNFTSNSVDVKGLTEGTNYYVAVFEFNGGSYTGVQNYLLTNPATGSQVPSSVSYYSLKTGDPSTLANWNTKRDGTGTSPSDFTTPATFIVQNGHTMTNTSAWAFGGSGSILEIENGGILQADYAITIASGATFKIDDGGMYIHNNATEASTSIFNGTESFSANSNVKINNWKSNTTVITTRVTLPFGNLELNWTGNSNNWQQGWSGTINLCAGNLTVTSIGTGTIRFSAGTAPTINIGGNFIQTSGTVNLASTSGSSLAVLNVGGNFSINGGSFTSTSTGSKVIFNGNKIQNFTNSGTISVVNFEVANSSILDLGNQILSGTSFTLKTGATLKTANASGIDGAITSTTKTFDPAANYEFNGTAAQVTGASLTTANNITINNPAGVTLSGATTLNGQLNLSSGNLITTETNLLTLGTGAAITGGSITSFVDGPMVWNVNEKKNYTFPVGKGSRYLPMVIKPSTADASIFKVTYNNTPYTNTTTFGTGIAVVSLLDYYELSKISGNAAVQLTMSWDATSGITTNCEQYLRVAHWNGSLWEDLGECTITGDHLSGTLTTNNAVSSFSPFVLASSQSDNPMPVSLKSLTSNVAGRNISLKWVTSQEINNSGFDVERKSAAGDYVKVGFVQGKGTVATATNYEFTDRNLQTGKYSYRLKQIDNNGNFEYFNLGSDAVVGVPVKFDLSQNYPNPFNPVTKINFDLPKDSKLSLKLYDMLGREVSTLVNEFRTAGYYTVDFNASSLSSGIYFYRLLAGEFSSVKKMVVLK